MVWRASMCFCVVNGRRMAYKVWRTGDKTIVIDTAISTCSAEWWHIADKLSERYRVITYDRMGYGNSDTSEKERTPQNIATELDHLLVSLNVTEDIILLGHSQGGFYSIQYALMNPQKVTGMVLLDPATPYDYQFSEQLTAEQYRKSGADKTTGMKLGLWLTSLGLGFAAKPLLRKMPPFYYHTFSKDAEDYLLKSLCQKSTYTAALEEYRFTHEVNTVNDVAKAIENTALHSLPIILITHSSEVYCKELQEFGRMDSQTAETIEDIWQRIMKKTLGLSHNAQHIDAVNSGHYIHLTDLDVVLSAVETFA